MRNRAKAAMLTTVLIFSLSWAARAYYNPQQGRWLNRDPMGERGGRNVYAFAVNSAISFADLLGLKVDKDLVDEGHLIYSCNCGWLDPYHAWKQEDVPRKQVLRHVIAYANGSGPISFTAIVPGVVSFAFEWLFLKPRAAYDTPLKQAELMMSIWMEMSDTIERMQSHFSRSGYSVEDLPSDYIAGLIGIHNQYPAYGLSYPDISSECVILGKEKSKRIIDMGFGPEEGRTAYPLLWSKNPGVTDKCWPCQGEREQVPKKVFFNVKYASPYGDVELLSPIKIPIRIK